MKRMTYVDSEGNATNIELESKKPLLRVLLVINILIPLVLIGLIIYTVIINKQCKNIHNNIKKSTSVYIKDQGEVPAIEGDSTEVNIGDLYAEQYLNSSMTNNTLCSGTVKITKYKKDYIYTLDVRNCNKCSVDKKYKEWSSLQNNYPNNKEIVDVIPYYNYYDRELNTTKWSNYYDEEELSDEVSEYGIKLPIDETALPEIPKEALLTNVENSTTYYYRYRDRSWKWYDIEGNYSEFSSERPDGFAEKDEDSEKETDWSEYSLDYPQEKSYREINQTTGYKFYYINKNNKKIYYNSGKYTPRDEVNTEKYTNYDEETAQLYRYKDKQWRWYNGQKRRYSSYSSRPYDYATIKDKETEILGSPTSWSDKKSSDETTSEYRIEEKKLMTKFRRQYEILSLLVLKNPLEKEKFEEKVKTSILEFSSREDKKIDVTYKFKYRKS